MMANSASSFEEDQQKQPMTLTLMSLHEVRVVEPQGMMASSPGSFAGGRRAKQADDFASLISLIDKSCKKRPESCG